MLLGDAELDEGSNMEAIQYAGRAGLGQPDRRRDRQLVRVAGLARRDRRRFTVEGWTAVDVDGRDHDALERAFRPAVGRPHVVVAHVEPKEA